VRACLVIPGNLLTLAIKTVLAFLTSKVVVNILEAWVLLDVGEDFTLLVGDVFDEDLGERISSVHLLLKFLSGDLGL